MVVPIAAAIAVPIAVAIAVAIAFSIAVAIAIAIAFAVPIAIAIAIVLRNKDRRQMLLCLAEEYLSSLKNEVWSRLQGGSPSDRPRQEGTNSLYEAQFVDYDESSFGPCASSARSAEN